LAEANTFYERYIRKKIGNNNVYLCNELPYADIPKLSKDEAEN
jgi:hypothetical protein